MGLDADRLFDTDVWRAPLETFGAVTHLTVALYDEQQHIVCGPFPSTPMFALMEAHGSDPGLFAECAARCMAQSDTRPGIIVNHSHGLAVVGTPLMLEGDIVGAAVAGYTLTDFADSTAIARLAQQIDVPFRPLWDLARQQQPLPQGRIVLLGELLQVLGDSLLRENLRTRQHADLAARLREAAAQKDDFLAVLSHELRSPLTPIIGWARMLKKCADPLLVARAAEVIERNARMQLEMVTDLVDVNRSIRGGIVLNLHIVEVSDAVALAVEAVEDLARRKGVTVVYEPGGGPTLMKGDATRLQQVFRNVLVNAIKFTGAGGWVRVTASRVGARVDIVCADTGEGIDPAFLPHVFEIFRQQETGSGRAQGGLGIGLALVKQLVDAHGGTVTVESAGTGRGTKVTVSLPLVVNEAEDQEIAMLPMSPAPSGLHASPVLTVEDILDVGDSAAVCSSRRPALTGLPVSAPVC